MYPKRPVSSIKLSPNPNITAFFPFLLSNVIHEESQLKWVYNLALFTNITGLQEIASLRFLFDSQEH